MSAWWRRFWLAVDELVGAVLLIWLCPPEWRKTAFLGALVWWAFCVYVVSYPWHWYLLRRERLERRERR